MGLLYYHLLYYVTPWSSYSLLLFSFQALDTQALELPNAWEAKCQLEMCAGASALETRVFSIQGHACWLRQVHWLQQPVLSLSFVAEAGQGADVGHLGLEPGQEEPG